MNQKKYARVPVDLTTDPYNKRGHIGEVIFITEITETACLLFADGSQGLYDSTCLEYLNELP